MKQKEQGDLSLLLIILLVVGVMGAVVFARKMYRKPVVEDKIQTVSDLNNAEQELDSVDVDGMGNEFNELSSDASSF